MSLLDSNLNWTQSPVSNGQGDDVGSLVDVERNLPHRISINEHFEPVTSGRGVYQLDVVVDGRRVTFGPEGDVTGPDGDAVGVGGQTQIVRPTAVDYYLGPEGLGGTTELDDEKFREHVNRRHLLGVGDVGVDVLVFVENDIVKEANLDYREFFCQGDPSITHKVWMWRRLLKELEVGE